MTTKSEQQVIEEYIIFNQTQTILCKTSPNSTKQGQTNPLQFGRLLLMAIAKQRLLNDGEVMAEEISGLNKRRSTIKVLNREIFK